MPVVGLSDRASLDPRFKEIGRIRKGAAKSGNRPGRDLDYFRYIPDSEHRESAQVFDQLYGKEPKELEVYFPFDQMERVFGSWRERYGQNRLCSLRCDGARWHDWVEGDRHYHSEAGRECDLKCRDTKHRCPDCPLQYVGRLSVMLKPMWLEGQIGLITVITTSVNDIANLSAKLVQWEPLTGKPFRLWRAPERIGVPIGGERRAKDSDLLHLELTEERFLLEFQAMERRAYARLEAPAPVPALQIGSGGDGPPSIDYDAEIIEGDEFLEADFHGAPPDAGSAADYKEHLEDEAEADSAQEAERQEAIETPPFLTPPEENDWTSFFRRCIEELNYTNPAHAAAVKDQAWLLDPRPSWDAMWTHMIEHQAEKGHL